MEKGSSKYEREWRAEFAERYAVGHSQPLVAIEQEVIGGDWGANGYTTMGEADELCDRLELDRSKRLLDVGSGQGWPGLYLSKKTGCELVITDVPIEELRTDLWEPLCLRRDDSRSGIGRSTLCVTRTCCVDCNRSSPC